MQHASTVVVVFCCNKLTLLAPQLATHELFSDLSSNDFTGENSTGSSSISLAFYLISAMMSKRSRESPRGGGTNVPLRRRSNARNWYKTRAQLGTHARRRKAPVRILMGKRPLNSILCLFAIKLNSSSEKRKLFYKLPASATCPGYLVIPGTLHLD